jgi:hypothetical protein
VLPSPALPLLRGPCLRVPERGASIRALTFGKDVVVPRVANGSFSGIHRVRKEGNLLDFTGAPSLRLGQSCSSC